MTSKELSEVYKYVTGKTFKLSELVEGWQEKEIKDCPFCGKEADYEEEQHAISCMNTEGGCGFFYNGEGFEKDELIKAWNTRFDACDKEVMVDEDYIQSEFDKLPNYDDEISDEMWDIIESAVYNGDKEKMTELMRISTRMTQRECKKAIAQNIKGILKCTE